MIDTQRARLPTIRPYDQVLLDLDGCLWVGDEPCDGAAEAVAALREARRGGRVPHQRRPSRTRGVRAQAVGARLPGLAGRGRDRRRRGAVHARRRGGGSAFVIGSQALVDHVGGRRHADRQPHGVRHPRRRGRGRRARRASTSRSCGSPPRRCCAAPSWSAPPATRTFPMPDGPWPGSGAVLAAVETAAGRTRRPGDRQARAGDVRGGARPARRRAGAGGRRPARGRRGRRAPRRAGLRARADRRHDPRARPTRRTRGPPTSPTRSAALVLGRVSLIRPMDRDVCLIVNPTAGAGRAARLLPDVEAALRAHGLRFRVERTTSIEHARELARAARDGRRDRGRDGRRRARRRGRRRAARQRRACWRVLPGGRGNDFARKLGIGARPGGGRASCWRRARAADRPGRGGGARLPRDPQRRAWTPTSTGSRTRTRLPARHRRVRLRRAARAGALEAGALGRDRRRRPSTRSPGTPWPWPTRASSAAACAWCPTPSSTTACSTSC